MDDMVIVYRPCIVCNEYRTSGSNGVTTNTAGFVCSSCRDEFENGKRRSHSQFKFYSDQEIADELNGIQITPA